MKIEDGTGKGYKTKVNSENRLYVEAVAKQIDLHINEEHGKYWSLPFEAIDPVGADDYFFYLKNTGTKNIHVTDVRVYSTVAGTLEVRHVSGTPSYTAGADVTPVNRTLGNSETPIATVKTDTDTTGLTNEGVIFYHRLDTANEERHLRPSAHIIIPPGQAMAFLWDTSTGVLTGVVSIYEED